MDGPSTHQPPQITALLQAWTLGDRDALDRLTPVVYEELHRRARNYLLRERAAQSMQPTALVNEAYLRLIEVEGVRWQDRAHFFALASQIMRRILVDAALAVGAQAYVQPGGQDVRVTLVDGITAFHEDESLVRLDDALSVLAQIDGRKARVIELRFFGGLSVKETAEVLGVSTQTVLRDWKLAKAWLTREMQTAS